MAFIFDTVYYKFSRLKVRGQGHIVKGEVHSITYGTSSKAAVATAVKLLEWATSNLASAS